MFVQPAQMSKVYTILLLVAYFSAKSAGVPVENGQNVGTLEVMGNVGLVTGQKMFPFVAHITIDTWRNGKKQTSWCTGVVIAKNAVLTAAHCVHSKVKPTVTVHVGIVETKWEKNAGQKVISTQRTTHGLFKPQCAVGSRCCYGTNDLTILWLEEDLKFGAYVKPAPLNKNEDKPIDKEGWILGWGLTNNGYHPTMLQKGLVKVVGTRQCERHNKRLYITQKVICLTGVKPGTKSGSGDSGGPFVIDDVVYGISSFAAHESCQTLDVYTHIAKYIDWIDQTIKNGPPKVKVTSTTVKPPKSKKKRH